MARFIFFDDKIINILLEKEKPSGGAAVQAYGWIRGLLESGQDIHVVTNPYQSGDSLKEECKGINIIPLYNRQKGIRWLRWIYYRFPYLYSRLKQAKPDFLYQGVPGWTSFFLGMICYQLKIKFVLRISNDYLLDERILKNYSKTHRFFQNLGIKLSDCVLCQNDFQLGVIRKEYPNKVAIKISNPIFLKSDQATIDAQSRHYIAWLGLYQYQKNLKLLFEIAITLKNEKFVIAGKESSKCDQETHHYLHLLQQLPNVEFAGFLQREQVLPFLANAKFLLNTSHYEGFSNTFLEAMTVGTPIITSYKVNPDSIITDHNLGLIYNEPKDLLKQYLAITPEAYKIMSENVLGYVLEHHEYKRLARKLINHLSIN